MGRTMKIHLQSIEKVKAFVNSTSRMEGNVMISSEKYTIDAKSILAIFSIDITKPLVLHIEKWKDKYAMMLEPYLL